MKFPHIAVVFLISLGCGPSTVFYKLNDSFDTVIFDSKAIAVCPITGEWRVSKSDSTFCRIPGLDQYPEAIANELQKKRPCLRVMHPSLVVKQIPDIEYMIAKHKASYQNMTAFDTLGFKTIKAFIGADYLFFIDYVVFKTRRQYTGVTTQTYKQTSATYQFWDLNSITLLARAESSGEGLDYADLMKNLSGKTAVTNVACEIVRNLPSCQKQ